MAYLEVLKLELKITEDNLTEIIFSESKNDFEKEKISNFKIKLLKNRFEVEGKKEIFLIKVPFTVSGTAKKFSDTEIEVDFEKINFLNILSFSFSVSPKRLVDDIVKKGLKGIKRGKENSILVDITNINNQPYKLQVKLQDVKIYDGYVLVRA